MRTVVTINATNLQSDSPVSETEIHRIVKGTLIRKFSEQGCEPTFEFNETEIQRIAELDREAISFAVESGNRDMQTLINTCLNTMFQELATRGIIQIQNES